VREGFIQDEIAVDLVGAKDEVVTGAEFTEEQEFVATPDAGERVVRVAEEEELGFRGDGELEGVPINVPAGGGCG
jgi:hypothetical protein